jgi:phosphoglycolate phosphatase
VTLSLLFDLDGTLTDSRRGIAGCIRYALRELGHRPPPDGELTQYIGPPLAASFATLLGTSDSVVVDQAIAIYRGRYDGVGIFENDVYPGIRDALMALAEAGHHMHVVTAKPRPYAVRIIEHFGLASLFASIHGPGLSDRNYAKAALIQAARAGARGPDALMIGDRADDVLAAREAGAGAIGVTWGYGTRAELELAGADALIDSPAALVTHVVRSASVP